MILRVLSAWFLFQRFILGGGLGDGVTGGWAGRKAPDVVNTGCSAADESLNSTSETNSTIYINSLNLSTILKTKKKVCLM